MDKELKEALEWAEWGKLHIQVQQGSWLGKIKELARGYRALESKASELQEAFDTCKDRQESFEQKLNRIKELESKLAEKAEALAKAEGEIDTKSRHLEASSELHDNLTHELKLANDQIENMRKDQQSWRNEMERQASFKWNCNHPRNLYVGSENGEWICCECWADAAEQSLSTERTRYAEQSARDYDRIKGLEAEIVNLKDDCHKQKRVAVDARVGGKATAFWKPRALKAEAEVERFKVLDEATQAIYEITRKMIIKENEVLAPYLEMKSRAEAAEQSLSTERTRYAELHQRELAYIEQSARDYDRIKGLEAEVEKLKNRFYPHVNHSGQRCECLGPGCIFCEEEDCLVG